MGRNVNKQSRICWPHIFNKFIYSVISLHAWLTIFGSFSCIYGSRFQCLNMVKMLYVNNSDLKDTGIASLISNLICQFHYSYLKMIVHVAITYRFLFNNRNANLTFCVRLMYFTGGFHDVLVRIHCYFVSLY